MTENEQKQLILNSDRAFIKLEHPIIVYKSTGSIDHAKDPHYSRRTVITTLMLTKGSVVYTGYKYNSDKGVARKMRASSAVVLMTQTKGGELVTNKVVSHHKSDFFYKQGERVKPPKFSREDHECEAGIHFFLTRKEAEDYT